MIGTGKIGCPIIDELLRLKAAGTISSVTVFSRSVENATVAHPEWVAQGVKFATADYYDPRNLLTAFRGVDVAISAVEASEDGLHNQKALGDCAKVGGVKIFVPSEFGTPTSNPDEIIGLKIHIRDYLREIKMPFTLFYTGPCTDLLFNPVFGFDFAGGKVTVPGGGDTPISFTGSVDVARYIVHILTTLPKEKLEWKVFRMEAERTTFNEILKSYQEKTGKTLEIDHIPRSELEKRSDLIAELALRWDKGDGVVGPRVDNDLYPEWNPKKVAEYFP